MIDQQNRIDRPRHFRNFLPAPLRLAISSWITRTSRIPVHPRRHHGRSRHARIASRNNRGIVHIRRRPHHRYKPRINSDLPARRVVITLPSRLSDRRMPLPMVRPLTTLMIHQIPQPLPLPPIPNRSADHPMPGQQLRHQKPPVPYPDETPLCTATPRR